MQITNCYHLPRDETSLVINKSKTSIDIRRFYSIQHPPHAFININKSITIGHVRSDISRMQQYNPSFTPQIQCCSARWEHTVVVLNQTSSYRNDLSIEEKSEMAMTWVFNFFVIGGDETTARVHRQSGRGHKGNELTEMLAIMLEELKSSRQRNQVLVV